MTADFEASSEYFVLDGTATDMQAREGVREFPHTILRKAYIHCLETGIRRSDSLKPVVYVVELDSEVIFPYPYPGGCRTIILLRI
jgi:hypothetical protein